MSSRAAKASRRRLTAEDRADSALIRRTLREMEERGEKAIPLEEVKRELAELRAREDAAAAERDHKRLVASGARPKGASPKAPGTHRRAAASRPQG